MFTGIAFCGKKGVGKDLLTDHFCATRLGAMVYRCKEPIVTEYERIVGHPYQKRRDDGELIRISRDIIRKNNDNIVHDWLLEKINECIVIGGIPVIPDLRRIPEFVALRELQVLCVKVEASDETRLRRIEARDGTLSGYDMTDSTEVDVDAIHCPYLVDNDRNDGGEYAIQQLESYLSRQGPLFKSRGENV